MHLVHLLWVSKREELNRTNKISTFSFETFGIQLNFTVNTSSHLNFITIQFRLYSPNLKTNHASTTFSWQTPLILAVRFLQNFFFPKFFIIILYTKLSVRINTTLEVDVLKDIYYCFPGIDSRYFDQYDPPDDVTCVDLDNNTISL